MRQTIETYRGLLITLTERGYGHPYDCGFLKLEYCRDAIDESLRAGEFSKDAAVSAIVLDAYDVVRSYGHAHDTAVLHATRIHGVPQSTIATMLLIRRARELERLALLAEAQNVVSIHRHRKQG